jgi:peptide/nickel transport system ATP-binding protein
MDKTKDLLNVEDLDVKFYTYEGTVEAIDKANLRLKEGETLGLVGETGCGKSVTSLSVLVLVPPPGKIEGGKATLKTKKGDIDLLTQTESYMRSIRGENISMIFQDPRTALNPVYTVEEQVTEVFTHHRLKELVERVLEEIDKESKKKGSNFRLRFAKGRYQKMLKNPHAFSLRILSRIPIINRYKGRLRRETRKEVVRIIGAMKIPDPERVVDMYPHELSGGMAQRVVIAMALGCTPELLIADEPTTNLDVTVQAQILELIRELKGKYDSSVLYITHDLGVIAELCDRVAVMYAGNVVELGEVEEIFKNPLHPYTQALLESIPRPGKEFKSIEGEVPSLISPPIGCRFNPRCSKATGVCTQEKPRFVEIDKDHFVMCHLFPGGSK